MPHPSYFDRYIAGQYVAVWRSLIELGAEIREEPLYSDALLVRQEIVRRARHNLRTLHDRLLTLGYQFASPDLALVDAGPEAKADVRQVEGELGTFPLLARV